MLLIFEGVLMDDDSVAGLRINHHDPRSQIHPLFLKKSLKTLKLIVILRKQLFNVTMLGRGTKRSSYLQPQLHPWVLVLGKILNINMCYVLGKGLFYTALIHYYLFRQVVCHVVDLSFFPVWLA